MKALNRLCKWRTVFAGWQLGTRTTEDPEAAAVRDHREATMILRAEVSALANLLAEKGVFTIDEYKKQIEIEADYLSKSYEKLFPGFKASDIGMEIDPKVAVHTTKGWKP